MRSTNSKKLILITIIVLVSLIVIGGGVLAYTYFFTDAFLSEEQGFYKYLSKNSEILEMFADKDLASYNEKTQKETYNNNAEFSIAVNSNLDEETKKAIDEIQKHKITLSGSVDNVNKYAYQEVKLKYGESDVISGALINKNDYYGLQVNDIGLKPYIILENNNLKQFAKNLGLSEEEIKAIPEKIDFEKLKNQEIFTKDELKQLKDKYLKVITENISEDKFSKSEQDGMDVYTLTINEETAKSVVLSLIDTLLNDDFLLNKVKQLYIEQQGATEQEAQTLIDDFKQSLEDAKKALDETSQPTENNNNSATSGISVNDITANVIEMNPEPEFDENIYISVYVLNRDLVKTELMIPKYDKITLTKEKNKITIDVAECETQMNGITENTENNTPTTFKTMVSSSIEKIKTNNELTYKVITKVGEDNKEYVKANLSYTGLSEMNNVDANLLVDLDLSEILNAKASIMNSAQTSSDDTKRAMEEESVKIALLSLQTSIYQDSYTSGNEVVVNETTIKQALAEENLNNMTVSMNEDGTYKIQSTTTGNTYTVNSKGELTNTVSGDVAGVTMPQEVEEEKTMIISYNLKANTTFGEVQQQELAENNMYIINNKTYEQLENLFTTLGEKVSYKVMNFYKSTPIGQLIGMVETEDNTANLSQHAIDTFNQKFNTYEGNNVAGTTVNNLLQTVKSSNLAAIRDNTGSFVTIQFPTLTWNVTDNYMMMGVGYNDNRQPVIKYSNPGAKVSSVSDIKEELLTSETTTNAIKVQPGRTYKVTMEKSSNGLIEKILVEKQ